MDLALAPTTSGLKKPLLFEHDIETRFNDLDFYGHVNSTVYLDYVISSRWHFLAKKFGYGSQELAKRGLGFYLSEVRNHKFLRPIPGATRVRVTSYVSEVTGARAIVQFRMTDCETGKLHSSGELSFAIIDMTSMRPSALPDWAWPLFFHADV